MSDLALNNVDEFIFDNSMRMDERKTPFLKKYVAELKDNNTSRDYSGNQLVFDNSAISMSGSYVDWRNGVLEVPAVCIVSGVSNGNAINFTTPTTGAETDFLIAMKNGINIFDNFSVEFNSIQIVNATTYINAYLNMRLNTELSKSDEELHGSAFNYYKDNASSWIYSDTESPSGRGMTNNRNSFYKCDSCSSNSDELFNEGMLKRQLKMAGAMANNGKDKLFSGDYKTFNLEYIEHNAAYLAYYYNILIPLNWLYFFKELPLIRNGNMKITFSLNANCGVVIKKDNTGKLDYVSFQGSNNTFPLMVGASNIVVKTSATNKTVLAGPVYAQNTAYNTNTASLTTTGTIDMVVGCGSSNVICATDSTLYISFSVVKCNSSIGTATAPHSSFGLQTKKNQCRILVPTYQMSPQYQQIADSITEKKIPFLNVVGGQIFNCLPQSTFDKVIVQSIARAKRLIIIPYLSAGAFGNGTAANGSGTPFSEWKSPFSCAPSQTSPTLPLLSNMQITIASVIPVYQNPVSVHFEHYLNEVQSTGLNFGLLTGCSSSTISMKDHANCYGYFIAKLDRRLPQDENVPISIQITGMNNCLKALDLYCYVEYMDESFCINPNTGQKLVAV